MPRTPKDPQGREVDDDEDLRDAPRVDESEEVEEEERARASLEDDEDDDDLAEEIRVEDLAAMEGPDA
jgi:hypothetical protein